MKLSKPAKRRWRILYKRHQLAMRRVTSVNLVKAMIYLQIKNELDAFLVTRGVSTEDIHPESPRIAVPRFYWDTMVKLHGVTPRRLPKFLPSKPLPVPFLPFASLSTC